MRRTTRILEAARLKGSRKQLDNQARIIRAAMKIRRRASNAQDLGAWLSAVAEKFSDKVSTKVHDKKTRTKYSENIATFDIETTSFIIDGCKRAVMYIWMLNICGECIHGRTWEEFIDTLEAVKNRLNLEDDNIILPIYIHNEGFEFSFLYPYINIEECFALDSHKPVRVKYWCFEFRDSLAVFGCRLQDIKLTRHKCEKLTGSLDYNKMRHHETKLTVPEYAYCYEDINVLYYAVQEKLEDNDDTMATIPITRTGYIRRKLKRAMKKCKKSMALVKSLTMSEDVYNQLKCAASGGFTHAGIHAVGRKLDNVESHDKTSFYPWAILANKFPMTPWRRVKEFTKDEFWDWVSGDYYACCFKVTLTNLRPKFIYEQYFSESKCIDLVNPQVNNGRVAYADEVSYYVTEHSFWIVQQDYEWDEMYIDDLMLSVKDYLPKPIIEVMLDAYEAKTKLKGIPEEIVYYMLGKEFANSIFGCMFMDPIRASYSFSIDTWSETAPDISEGIEQYNNGKQRFLSYAWGVWIPQICQRWLWRGILVCGEHYAYCDTDSLKIWHCTDEIRAELKKQDEEALQMVYDCLDHYGIDRERACPKTIKEVPKPIGVWDYEGTYVYFKTLGAKRYMYETIPTTEHPDRYHCTVAGIGKKEEFDIKKHGEHDDRPLRLPDYLQTLNPDDPFEPFQDKFIINPAFDETQPVSSKNKEVLHTPLTVPAEYTGKLTHTYFDVFDDGPHEADLTDYRGVTAHCIFKSGTHLGPQDYDLSMADAYIKHIFQYGFHYWENN